MHDQRVAVIGCGRMGKIRARAAKKAGAEIVTVCDSNRTLATELSGEFDECAALADFRNLNWDELTAIFVCTPPNLRGEILLTAMEHRIPFLIEKPIGVSCVEAQPVLDALASNWVINAVGYMNRYRESVQTCHQDLNGKKILGGAANWVNGKYNVPWWSESASSGGPINEQATHIVDLIRYFAGEVEEVTAIGAQHSSTSNRIDTASIQIRFQSGALFSVFYSCAATSKMIGVRIFTEESQFELDGWDFRNPHDVSQTLDKNAIFQVEVSAFLNAVGTNDSAGILVDFKEAFKTQRVIDAIGTSLNLGKAVRM